MIPVGDHSGLPYFGISAAMLGQLQFHAPLDLTHIMASGSLRLPFWGKLEGDISASVELIQNAPGFITIVNSTPDRPLVILQPQRPARRPYVDGVGVRHTFDKPPAGPLLGTLRGGLKSSWVQLTWVGAFHREWQTIGVFSEDFELAPAVSE